MCIKVSQKSASVVHHCFLQQQRQHSRSLQTATKMTMNPMILSESTTAAGHPISAAAAVSVLEVEEEASPLNWVNKGCRYLKW